MSTLRRTAGVAAAVLVLGAGAASTALSAPTLSAGQTVQLDRGSPPALRKALDGRRAVVVAFLLPGAADDDMVTEELRQVRSQPAMRRGVAYFVYRLGQAARFGDLPQSLGVTLTPSVVVIGRNRKLVHRFSGLVDAAVLRQSIADARSTPPSFRR
ncbi:MAG: hypothetical protein MUE51_02700 [Thermoleophilia bacterium]|nr:hypothetical protein [Thermoleophilia bacterium]